MPLFGGLGKKKDKDAGPEREKSVVRASVPDTERPQQPELDRLTDSISEGAASQTVGGRGEG